MGYYMKIPVTDQMIKDYQECAEIEEKGKEKDCSGCSCNGGDRLECLGNQTWFKEPDILPLSPMHIDLVEEKQNE